ncbi:MULTISPECIES: hypothetical protein [Spirosoma]|uniref:Uncharacterized protein n=1 Tax=Spirosoma liriopis TaxID=2937440 RepID=A0ABT0HDQ3_9BACT|nr:MULTISPECIES: hypothetical protein [Spirosoma]MCK8490292.1 hypothetical protein [Spirosoma liriopis]UHG89667.1 hypothetical protein LQ777_15590 [Spirosoma oryzicola]
MEDFTLDQIVSIANGYRTVARALNEFQVMHWSEFTYEQQLDLNAYQNSLLNRAQDLQTLAVRPAFSQVSETAAAIRQATDEAKAGLRRIRNVTIALNIGAITVALAAYVARANGKGIQSALRELADLLALDNEEPV